MLAILIISAAIGAALGSQFRISILVPAILFAVVGAIASGVIGGHDARTIALTTLGVVASLQIGYLIGLVAFGYSHVRATKSAVHTIQKLWGRSSDPV